MEPVTFFSDGLELVGDLYLPEGRNSPSPGIVFCGGWGGGKRVRAGMFAEGLAKEGYVCLAFEYRGWGDDGRKSEGDNDRLFPEEHTADACAAITYLTTRSDVDPSRLAMMGMFNGAAVTLNAACLDERIGAAIGLFPFGDGARWMRLIRRYHEWEQFLDRVAADRARRAVTGQTEIVDPNEILIRDEVALSRHGANRAKFADRAEWRLGLDSADAILSFHPEDHLDRLAGRPVLLIASDRDTLLPIEEVHALFERVREPKRLIELKSTTHDGTFQDGRQEWLIDQTAAFLNDAFAEDVRD